MKMRTLISLAEKGSPEDFSACLKGCPRPIPDEVLFSALRNALAWNQPKKVRLLLDAGADPLAMNEENSQLLLHAAISGGGELVKLMLELGCDANHRNIHGRTALHDAARFGNIEGVRILADAGAELDCRDERGQVPLIEAIVNNYPETAMELVRRGADIHGPLSGQQETPLMLAASRGATALVRLLLDRGSEIESRDFIGCTPLMHASRGGSSEAVRLLLEAGADRNARDKKGLNALQWASALHPEVSALLLGKRPLPPGEGGKVLLKAAADGNALMIKELLAQKARVQPGEEGGESALVNAVLQRRSPEAFQLLLQCRRANINYRYGKALMTPLMAAARAGDAIKARLLLERGADHAVTDTAGRSAVNHAAIAAGRDVLEVLHGYGAQLEHTDRMGRTALHLAIWETGSSASTESRTETVIWLLAQSVDPNAVDNAGMSPLMLAAREALADIAGPLLDAGAIVDLRDGNGRSALIHALYHGTDYGYEDRYTRPVSENADKAAPVIKVLLEAGADPNICDTLSIAERWRWPGAAALLRRFGAKEIPERQR